MSIRLAALAIFSVLLAGCEETLGPEATAHVGTYQLEQVNGEPLPWISETIGSERVQVTDATFTLKDDNTYVNEIHWLFTTLVDQTVRTESQLRAGEYQKRRDGFQFFGTPIDFIGQVTDSTLTIATPGFFAVYRRN